MFDVLALLSLPQRFGCEVFAVLRHMRHSRWQDTSSCNLALGAILHVISIPPELSWEDFLQEKRKRRNRFSAKPNHSQTGVLGDLGDRFQSILGEHG
jgi:hypothetical protein